MALNDVKVFLDDDIGYKAAKRANPNGWVLNVDQKSVAKSHRASCAHVERTRSAGENPLTRTYPKVIAGDEAELEEWLANNHIGTARKRPRTMQRASCCGLLARS